MLNKPIEEIVMENGKVVGVKSEGEVSILFSSMLDSNVKCLLFEWLVKLIDKLYVIFDFTKSDHEGLKQK